MTCIFGGVYADLPADCKYTKQQFNFHICQSHINIPFLSAHGGRNLILLSSIIMIKVLYTEFKFSTGTA